MQDSPSASNDFLAKITGIIEANISDERFGVSELASACGMSRSNLLRKIQKLTNRSVSQFIREVRLKQAMEILKESSQTVSEVSFRVGFSSTSYFIKCFREHYGYPPGEVGKGHTDLSEPGSTVDKKNRKKNIFLGVVALIAILIIILIVWLKPLLSEKKEPEKSIAVLPFKNDSNDSTNVYFINGLMESILTNLQQIEDLRVISRTSVEKYRDNPRTISEIAKELNVSYFVEGSGQKIDNQIFLNIQLIEAHSDKHLWAEQYDREATDIFNLQKEIAKNIADEIEVIITPEEEERISKVPTDNLIAYDYFLQGLDFLFKGDRESLKEAITWFNKAIEEDQEFARAYADLAITYYFLDIFQVEKLHIDQLIENADKALLYDPLLSQSLVAKALSYIQIKEYNEAVPFLEKALEYNPNSAMVINTLSDFYTNCIPDTEKYLEYALKGIKLDIAANDSFATSFIYLHISNALIQSGFTLEAEKYINRSLSYNPDNLYSEYVKAYILYAKNGNLLQTKDLLIEALSRDTTRLDIMQEIGKVFYYLRDFENAYSYYKKFTGLRKAYNLDIYPYENAKIGLVYSEMGYQEESDRLFDEYKSYAENDESIYRDLSLSVYYAYMGNTKASLEHFERFTEENNIQYWILLFLKTDPLMDSISQLPEFDKIHADMESKFWKNHDRIKNTLKKEGLLEE